MQKWPFLDTNHGLTTLEKYQFFDFLTSCFYSLERRFFVLTYRKRYFLGLYSIKQKVAKMAIFGHKPWVNPLSKNVNFWTFWTCCFYSLERRFFVLEYRKKIFLPYIAKEKKVGKMAIFGQKSLKKNINFSTLLTSCFYSLERSFFVLAYRKRYFLGLYSIKQKV